MVDHAITLDDLRADPHPHLARLRAAAPVAWVPALDGFVVTSRDAALEVLRDPATFTVDDPRFSTAQVIGPSMLSLDGPEHHRHRDPFVTPFRIREVTRRFAPFVSEQVHRRLSAIREPGRRRAELRRELASPLAASVVAQSLGLEGGEEALGTELVSWYGEIVGSVSAVAAGSAATAGGARAVAALADSLRSRLGGGRGDSVLHDAVAAGSLDPDEAIADAAVIMFGGIETTEGLILNTLWHLLTHRAQMAEVRSHPELVTAAVEESLRLEPAAARVDRYATRSTELRGTAINAGALVVVSLAAANRDPAEFSEPDRYDLHRPNLRRHLAFAAGPHVCIGMDLARLEARVAVAAVLAELPGVRLDDDAPPPTGLVFRKPGRLPVSWT